MSKRDIEAEKTAHIRNPNNLVDPAYNEGKDYVLLVEAIFEAAPEPKHIFRAIPELPLVHAFGKEEIEKGTRFYLEASNQVVYKVPKSLLERWDNLYTSLYGYYFTFISQDIEHSYTKSP